MGCNPVYPDTYGLRVLEKTNELLKVQIVTRNAVENGIEGWTKPENVGGRKEKAHNRQ